MYDSVLTKEVHIFIVHRRLLLATIREKSKEKTRSVTLVSQITC